MKKLFGKVAMIGVGTASVKKDPTDEDQIHELLKSLHLELREKCPGLRTKAVRGNKTVVTKPNHYERMKGIVNNGGTIDACYVYCNSVINNYNMQIAKHKDQKK